MMSSPEQVADIRREQAKQDAAELLRQYHAAHDNGDEALATQLWVLYLDAVSKSMREAACAIWRR